MLSRVSTCSVVLIACSFGVAVTAECGDVLLDPLERAHVVEHADVARIGPLAAEVREIQITEDVQAMVDRDRDDVVLARELMPRVDRVAARPAREPAAVEPDHHRATSTARLRCPDVEDETIFALRFARIGRQHLFRLAADDLRWTAAPLEQVAHTGPRL